MRLGLTVGLAALLIAGSASACGGGSSSSSASSGSAGVTKDSITIGTTNPLTGSVASACKPVSDGALAWFDHVNAAGGTNGRKIVNKVLDDQYTAQQALANARQLVGSDVFAMFGGCGTIQPPAIQPVLAQNKIPYFFPYAGLPALTTDKNVRLLLPLYGPQLDGLIQKAFKDHGAGTVFSVVQQTPAAQQTVDSIKASVIKAGGNVVGTATTTAGESDQTPLVLKVKQAAPDYVVISESAPDAARIINAMQSQNAYPKKFILGTSTLATGAFIGPAGQTANGRVLTVSPTMPATSSQASTCVDALKAKGVTPDGFSLFGCASAQTLTEAIKEAGPDPTRDGVLKVIDGWTNKAASPLLPALTFSAGSNVGEASMVLLSVSGGQFVDEGTLSVGTGS